MSTSLVTCLGCHRVYTMEQARHFKDCPNCGEKYAKYLSEKKQGRNELCECGSGKKVKKCCGRY